VEDSAGIETGELIDDEIEDPEGEGIGFTTGEDRNLNFVPEDSRRYALETHMNISTYE
jgi:hypothetical protein